MPSTYVKINKNFVPHFQIDECVFASLAYNNMSIYRLALQYKGYYIKSLP